MGELPDWAVNYLNYTLDRGVFPNQGGVARLGKSAILFIEQLYLSNIYYSYLLIIIFVSLRVDAVHIV